MLACWQANGTSPPLVQLEVNKTAIPMAHQQFARECVRLGVRSPSDLAAFFHKNPLMVQTVLPMAQEAFAAATRISSSAPPFLVSLASIAVKRSSLSRLLLEVAEVLVPPPPSRPVTHASAPSRSFSTAVPLRHGVALIPAAVVMGHVARRFLSSAVAGKGVWHVWRADSNGVRVLAASFPTQAAAAEWAEGMEAKGHKQTFWVSQDTPASDKLWMQAR